MRTGRLITTALLGALALTLALPVSALGLTTYTEGTASKPFSVESLSGARALTLTGGDPAIMPKKVVLWQFTATNLDPRSIQALSNGNVLIASRDGGKVLEVDPSGSQVWTYTTAEYQAAFNLDDKAVFTPFAAQRFTAPDGSQHTLITLRSGKPVFEIDEHKNLVWQYGTGVQGTGPGQLWDAFSATRLSSGNTLIADNQGCRVIEVNPAGAIVWQYGVAGEEAVDHEFADGYLGWPRSAQRLDANPSDGKFTTLIADEHRHQVIEVDQSGSVVWCYGVSGVPGTGPGQLFDPAQAVRLPDGSTMIIDNPNKLGRIQRIGKDHSVLEVYPDPEDMPEDGALAETRSLAVLQGGSSLTGSMLIADQGHQRVLRIGFEPTAKVTSLDVDCGLPGVNKRFRAISWRGTAPTGSSVTLYYAVNDGAWKTAGSATRTLLPSTAVGTRIKYRIVMKTAGATAPRLDEVSIECEPAADHEATGGGTTNGSSSTTSTSSTTESTSAASIPSGAKSRSGGALLSDAGAEVVLDGPLEAAAGQLLAAGAISTPGLPGLGGATGGTSGTAAALGLTYLAGLAWYPTREGLSRLLPSKKHAG